MERDVRDGAAGENEPMLGARTSIDSTDDRSLSHEVQKEGRLAPPPPSSKRNKMFKIMAVLCAITLIVLPSFIFVHFFRAQQHPAPGPSHGSGDAGHDTGHAHGGHDSGEGMAATTAQPRPQTTVKAKTSTTSNPSPSPSPIEAVPEEPSTAVLAISPADQLNLKTGFVITDSPTTRSYVFNITRELRAPDGYEKSMILVNGQFPGPLIEANVGDTIRVVVNNQMTAESTTIHWHGIDQRNTTWMDGVAGVSQCGIPPRESFTYEFVVSGQRGTFWYHSHLTVQYVDGLYGPLVIHDPSELVPQVEDDKIIMIGDLHHRYGQELLADYLGESPPWSKDGPGLEPPPDNIVINGAHVSNCSAPPEHEHEAAAEGMGGMDGMNGMEGMNHGAGRRALGTCALGSLYSTNVKTGDRVRLRVISSSANAPYYFTIDNHTLEVVEMDGVEIEPLKTTRLFMNPGQRYSVLITADQPAGNYLMRVSVATHCFHLPGGMHQKQTHGDTGMANIDYEATAVLSYDDTDVSVAPIGSPWDLKLKSTPDVGKEPWKGSCHDMPFDLPQAMRKIPAYDVGPNNYHYFKYRTGFDGGVYRTFINKTVNVPLEDDAAIWQATLLNGTSIEDSPDLGSKQHLLVSMDDDMGAQIVINSQHMMSHPWHLHFQIVGWGPDFFGRGKTTWNLGNPIRRDTLTVMGDSHVVIRIKGDNPGLWALHCHILWHAEGGMAVAVAQRLAQLRSMIEGLSATDGASGVRNRFCARPLSRPTLPEGSGGEGV